LVPMGCTSGEYCTMGETLMQRRRVSEEVFRYVKLYQQGRKMTVPDQEAPANYVPAAAVIRRGQALSGFTGCKGSVDGEASLK
ncbi:hypothetical protein BTO03_26225, partial [Vibrio parahaemolyticus]